MENLFKILIGVGGSAITYLFGGWSSLLGVLLAFIIIDYMTGIIASASEGYLASGVGFRGIAKKILIFLLVSIANLIDTGLGDGHLFRDATIFFYLANELLSIIENIGRLGLPIPEVIKKAVKILNEKSEVEK